MRRKQKAKFDARTKQPPRHGETTTSSTTATERRVPNLAEQNGPLADDIGACGLLEFDCVVIIITGAAGRFSTPSSKQRSPPLEQACIYLEDCC